MPTAPALFVSHGSPMFALEPGALGPLLNNVGAGLDAPVAICIVSAHWQTRGVCVSTALKPETIHDFSGFPNALYQLRYSAAGAPEVAKEAAALLRQAGFAVTEDPARGLDHGAWVPLRYLEPAAKLPVFQVSLPHDLDAAGALRFGAALAPLRRRGVVVVGSGSLTHNLREVFRGTKDIAYAREFAEWVRRAVGRRDRAALMGYRSEAPEAARAHPTEEHFLPLLVAFGASAESDELTWLDGGMTYEVLSMDSYLWSAVR